VTNAGAADAVVVVVVCRAFALDLQLLQAAKSLLVAMCANPQASDATTIGGRKHLFVKLGTCLRCPSRSDSLGSCWVLGVL
jgi:hypothetical protein